MKLQILGQINGAQRLYVTVKITKLEPGQDPEWSTSGMTEILISNGSHADR